MLGKIKEAIQDRLYKNCIEDYQRELHYQTDPYLLWVKENEEDAKEEYYPDLGVVYIEHCGRSFSLSQVNKEYIVFVSGQGRIAVNAFHEVMQYFSSHPEVNVVYADEDAWMLEGNEETRSVLKWRIEKIVDVEHSHRIFPCIRYNKRSCRSS